MHVNDILLRPDLQSLAERLYQNCDWSGGPLSCWLWLGQVGDKGYGKFRLGKVKHQVATHRFSYVIANGPLPEQFEGRETWVLHHCDNPPCCNPTHLFLGNSLTNPADMVSKDRQARGERSGKSKLTEITARSILSSLEAADVLAFRYGVSKGAITRLRLRHTWRHLGELNARPYVALRGENAPTAKLTEAQAIAIITDPRSHAAIAAAYGLSRRHIGNIKQGRAWKHLPRNSA